MQRDDQSVEKSVFQLTRELELLISGALVFALLQLPGILDGWWHETRTHVAGRAFVVPFSAYYAAKLASYGLIATIFTHFLLRGLWVALLGLRGVFPEGIDYTKLHQGPFMRRFYERRIPTLGTLEAKVDRVAALMFSFVFLYLILLFIGTLWVTVAGAIAFVVGRLAGRPSLFGPVFFVVLALFVVAQSIVATADKTSRKSELNPKLEALASRILNVIHYASLNFLYAPMFLTLTTRISKRVVMGLQLGFFYTLIAVFVVSVFVAQGVVGFDSYAWFPPNAPRHEMYAGSYESLRSAGSRALVPTVQSEVITDPYVRLFVPYNARRDNEIIRRRCPDVRPFRSDGFYISPRGRTPEQQTAAVIRCFALVYSVALDGKPVDTSSAYFHIRPGGIHGRIVMIPAAGLASGKHEVLVRRNRVPEKGKPATPDEYYIPFWR